MLWSQDSTGHWNVITISNNVSSGIHTPLRNALITSPSAASAQKTSITPFARLISNVVCSAMGDLVDISHCCPRQKEENKKNADIGTPSTTSDATSASARPTPLDPLTNQKRFLISQAGHPVHEPPSLLIGGPTSNHQLASLDLLQSPTPNAIHVR